MLSRSPAFVTGVNPRSCSAVLRRMTFSGREQYSQIFRFTRRCSSFRSSSSHNRHLYMINYLIPYLIMAPCYFSYKVSNDTKHVKIFYSRSEEHTSELQSLAYLVC